MLDLLSALAGNLLLVRIRRPGPTGRILPRLKIASDRCDTLFDSIRERSQPKRSNASHNGTDVFERAEFQKRINEALSWYVSNVAFEPTIPEMRRQLESWRKQVALFFGPCGRPNQSNIF
jgi:hypothetical protein